MSKEEFIKAIFDLFIFFAFILLIIPLLMLRTLLELIGIDVDKLIGVDNNEKSN